MSLQNKLLALLGMLFGIGTAAAAEILIGSDIPLTGSLARVGSSTHEGIQTAVEVFNQTNGKHTIKLITMDNESSPAKAIAGVEKMASQGVVAFTGGYGTNVVSPAAEAADKLGLVYITTGVFSDSITEKGLKTYFRVINSDGYRKAILGLIESLGEKSVSIVYSAKEATSGLAKDLQAALQQKNYRVAMHEFDPAATDFKPIVNKIKLSDRSDLLVISGYENDYLNIIRAAKVLKPPVKAIIGGWGIATAPMAKSYPDVLNYTFGTSMTSYPAEFKTEEGKIFAQNFAKLFHKEPDYLAMFGYVQSMVLFEAIARVLEQGPMDPAKIVAELEKTDRDTLIGRVKFNEKHDNQYFTQYMGQHQNGKVVIVWPKDKMTAPMVYPGVPW